MDREVNGTIIEQNCLDREEDYVACRFLGASNPEAVSGAPLHIQML